MDFVPVPVISGFTSAAAIQIAIGQLKVHVRTYIQKRQVHNMTLAAALHCVNFRASGKTLS